MLRSLDLVDVEIHATHNAVGQFAHVSLSKHVRMADADSEAPRLHNVEEHREHIEYPQDYLHPQPLYSSTCPLVNQLLVSVANGVGKSFVSKFLDNAYSHLILP
jgi:hypothetical protein